MHRHSYASLLVRCATIAVVALVGGCANWPRIIPDVAPLRRERLEKASDSISSSRNEIEYQAALSYRQQGDELAARKVLEAMADRRAMHLPARQALVETLLSGGEIASAVDRGVIMAEQFPDDADTWQLLAVAYEEAGNTQAAEDCHEHASSLEPLARVASHPPVRKKPVTVASHEEGDSGSSKVLQALETTPTVTQQPPKALPSTSAAALEQPVQAAKPAVVHDPSAALMMAEIALACGDAPAAHRFALEVLSETPEDGDAQALAHRAEVESPRGAALVSNRSPQTLPARAPARQESAAELERRGTVALTAGAPEAAADYFERAIQLAPEDETLATRVAVAALRNAQPELAVRLAQTGLRYHSDSAALYRTLGTAQYRLEDWKASQAALRQALSLDNTNPLSYFLMGSTLARLGDTNAADWHYRQARQRDPRYALR